MTNSWRARRRCESRPRHSPPRSTSSPGRKTTATRSPRSASSTPPIMTDVQSLQQLAGQDQERLRNAAGADSAGGSLGTAIAVYGEAPDEEYLATLRTATEAFFAWIAVLA